MSTKKFAKNCKKYVDNPRRESTLNKTTRGTIMVHMDSKTFNDQRRVTVLMPTPEAKNRVDEMLNDLEYRKMQDGYREIFLLGLIEFEKKHKVRK
jgi:hypothetical protein